MSVEGGRVVKGAEDGAHAATPTLQQVRGGQREFVDAILASQDWWFEHSDPGQAGLPAYLHPSSSGLDDSPIFDHDAIVRSPDLGAYLVLQDRILAQWLRDAGRLEGTEHCAARAERTLTLLERNWDSGRRLMANLGERGQALPSDAVVGLNGRTSPMVSLGWAGLLCGAGARWPSDGMSPTNMELAGESSLASSMSADEPGLRWKDTAALVRRSADRAPCQRAGSATVTAEPGGSAWTMRSWARAGCSSSSFAPLASDRMAAVSARAASSWA